jgi:hypothetical protein
MKLVDLIPDPDVLIVLEPDELGLGMLQTQPINLGSYRNTSNCPK